MDKPLNSQSRFAFIVGAPRCGTTTLASFLQQHPDVCFSAVKEPHFFSRDEVAALGDNELQPAVEEEYWQRFFGHCEGDPKLYAEGSVTYLYAPERMAPILKLWPDAKFVIALRDPLAMLPSLHARLLVTGDETIRDFPTAWAKIGERAQGKSRSQERDRPSLAALRLGGPARRAMSNASSRRSAASRCHIVLFDDLSRDPQGTYRELCRFLGIDPWSGTNFKPQRINKTIRIGWLQRLLKRPPKAVRTALAGEKFHKREKQVGTRRKPGALGHLPGPQAAARMEQGSGQAPAARSRRSPADHRPAAR